jgi:hypothetical protein
MSRAAQIATTVAVIGSLIMVSPVAADDSAGPALSGHWGRSNFNLEQPQDGPKFITNTLKKKDGTLDDDAGRLGDYNNPILTPEAAAILKAHGEFSMTGMSIPDPHNQCWPEPPPFTMSIQLELLVLQRPDEVVLIYSNDQKVRHIRLNSTHPNPLAPTYAGDSIGHYEGDTLVVDTVGIKPGPYAMVDRYGSPVTPALHVVERYRLIDGAAARETQDRYEKFDGRLNAAPRPLDPDISKKGLQIFVTVEDPNVFTTAWSATVTYRPMAPNMAWLEQVCAENPNEYYKDRWIGLPKADQPDF